MERIRNVLIVGSGLMGSGIALSCVISRSVDSILLYDTKAEQLERTKAVLRKKFEWFKRKDSSLEDSALDRIAYVTKIESDRCGSDLLVIETVPEDLELKRSVFKDLSSIFKDRSDVILVTNTSSLLCTDIGVFVSDPIRFAGLHFSNPVEHMKLVEIIRTDHTSDRTQELLEEFVSNLGKVPVRSADRRGFILNRLLIPYLANAVHMMEQGDATKEDIDATMKLGAGHAMGPIELVDMIGLDTCKMIADRYVDENGRRLLPLMPSVDELVAAGHLGRKTGQGYYSYRKNDKKDSSKL